MHEIDMQSDSRPANAGQLGATNPRLEKFFARVAPMRGRLIIAIDATASRQPTWDMASKLQGEMFKVVAAIGGLDVQLVYYHDLAQCVSSRWLSDPGELTRIMRSVFCVPGPTQIGRVLRHAREENRREKVNSIAVISDACEEPPGALYDAARTLGMPAFFFQEGDDAGVGSIYAEIARLTNGAVARFDAGAAGRLSDLLRAVAAFAAGGVKALAAQHTEAATLLLTQIKR
jgi:hypothetical protein